jgi:hypothetical protein
MKLLKLIVFSILLFLFSFNTIFSICLNQEQADATFYCDGSGCHQGYLWEYQILECCQSMLIDGQPASPEQLDSVSQQISQNHPIQSGLYDRWITDEEVEFVYREGNTATLTDQRERHKTSYQQYLQTQQRNQVIASTFDLLTSRYIGILLLFSWGYLLITGIKKKLLIPVRVFLFLLPFIWLLLSFIYGYLSVEIMC